jgi:hypothetical protein
LFLFTLKLAKNLAFASWIICSLCSSNWGCTVRTVRAYAGAAEVTGGDLDLAPGRDPVGEERS